MGPRRREHGLEPLAGVGRAADDLQGGSGASRDLADLQPVGVGMPIRLDNLGDDEVFQRGGRIVHGLDLEPDSRERLDDLAERSVSFEMVFEPREGELHFGGPERMIGLRSLSVAGALASSAAGLNFAR